MSEIKIQQNIPLSRQTTFRIGGPAKYFFAARTKKDILKAVGFAKKKLPYFILGGGSNLLVKDEGFKGLIIKTQNTKYEIQNTRINADAGVGLSDLVNFSINNGLTGLEWAIGIPGTIGGAVKVGTSAFGQSISESVVGIEKTEGIILSVVLKLKKGDKKISEELIKKYIQKRKNSQPLEYASAGCIFKNPKGKLAGQLINQAGLKGKQIGQAMVSEKHANFIINLGGAKSEDVIKLINLIKRQVKRKFNLELKEEIQYLGCGGYKDCP
jgi:UDP-N-acetylmuramate dehydrogenase